MNITSEQVSDWLREQLAKAHEFGEYASITAEIRAYKGGTITGPEYSIYHGRGHESGRRKSIEDCFEDLRGETPQTIADRLLEQAAELTTKANEILAKAQP